MGKDVKEPLTGGMKTLLAVAIFQAIFGGILWWGPTAWFIIKRQWSKAASFWFAVLIVQPILLIIFGVLAGQLGVAYQDESLTNKSHLSFIWIVPATIISYLVWRYFEGYSRLAKNNDDSLDVGKASVGEFEKQEVKNRSTEQIHHEVDSKVQALSQGIRQSQTEEWELIVSFYPSLKECCDKLEVYGADARDSFISAMLAKKNYDEAESVKARVLRQYGHKKFGANLVVSAYGLRLLSLGRRDAAGELERIVKVLGPNGDSKLIISKISNQFFNGGEPEIDKSIRPEAGGAAESFLRNPVLGNAKAFLRFVGCEIKSSNNYREVIVIHKGVERRFSEADGSLIEFATNLANTYM